MNSKVAIMGGAGFIGSELCRKLLPNGHEILVYDNFFTGKQDNLPEGYTNLTVTKGDINDRQNLLKSLSDFKPALVFHLAALHYIPYCDSHPEETLRVNVEGTESVLQVCSKINPDKVIFASSAAVYGIYDKANTETDIPGPYDIYGYSKYFGERLTFKFHNDTSIPAIVARIFNTYGPYETNPHVIPGIVDQVKNGNSTITLGDIMPERDFIYVEDMAEALIALAENTANGFDTFNVATGEEHSVETVLREVEKILNRQLTVISSLHLKRDIDRMHLLANVSKIKKETGWKARFSITEGLKKTLDFYL